MDKIKGTLVSIGLLVLLCSGAFARVIDFSLWLFLLQNSQPNLSIIGQIFVRVLVFVVSYEIVGLLFGYFGLYNGKFMKVAYFIISTFLGIAFSYIVWTMENYAFYILIALAVIVVLLFGIAIISVVKRRQRTKNPL